MALAVKHLRRQPRKNRVLILLTDGTNTAGSISPEAAARLAAEAKVRIYTIGIGGGQVGVQTPFVMLLHQPSDTNSTALKAIARETGGRFFQATDTQELENVYRELDRLEPTIDESRTYRPMRALYEWPAGAALLLTVWLAAARLSRRARLASLQEGRRHAA
jgi:Ca-activated chloride channel family protein